MTLRKIVIILFFLSISTPVEGQNEIPLRDLIGIPVMEGLHEDLESRIMFDKAEGRIVHIVLVGNRSSEDAEAFYRETLFQLGWREMRSVNGTFIFLREDESLTMVINQDSSLTIELDLAPAS